MASGRGIRRCARNDEVVGVGVKLCGRPQKAVPTKNKSTGLKPRHYKAEEGWDKASGYKKERFIVQKPCDGAELLASQTPLGMTTGKQEMIPRTGLTTGRVGADCGGCRGTSTVLHEVQGRQLRGCAPHPWGWGRDLLAESTSHCFPGVSFQHGREI